MASQRPLDPAARLTLAREAKGVSLKHVAEATKLSVRVIDALEHGRLAALPSGIYRRSIIRAVACEVGLNPEQLLAEFVSVNPEALPAPESAAMVAAVHVPLRSSLQRAMTIAGAVAPIVAGLVYFAWPAPSAPVATTRTYSPPDAVDWRPEVLPAGGFTEPPRAAARTVVVTLTLSSRCSLRVIVDGREVLARIVEAGETFPLDLAEELYLSGDNAAAVQFSINGQAGRPFGAAGEALDVRIGRDDYESFLVRH